MINLYLTEIKTQVDGKLVTFCGPNVPGISFEDAQNYCNNNELGYCKVIGLLRFEVECDDDTYSVDWNNEINHDIKRLN